MKIPELIKFFNGVDQIDLGLNASTAAAETKPMTLEEMRNAIELMKDVPRYPMPPEIRFVPPHWTVENRFGFKKHRKKKNTQRYVIRRGPFDAFVKGTMIGDNIHNVVYVNESDRHVIMRILEVIPPHRVMEVFQKLSEEQKNVETSDDHRS